MEIKFEVLGKAILELDLPAPPEKSSTVRIGTDLYTINDVRHVFEPTGRGGNYDHSVEVTLQKLKW